MNDYTFSSETDDDEWNGTKLNNPLRTEAESNGPSESNDPSFVEATEDEEAEIEKGATQHSQNHTPAQIGERETQQSQKHTPQNLISDAKRRRRETNRSYRQRVGMRAKDALKAERLSAEFWVPTRLEEVTVVVCITFAVRWICEQCIRRHTAFLGFQLGVNIH